MTSGAQPRWVHTATSTRISGLIERHWFCAYGGCWSVFSESGSASSGSICGSIASIAWVRLAT